MTAKTLDEIIEEQRLINGEALSKLIQEVSEITELMTDDELEG